MPVLHPYYPTQEPSVGQIGVRQNTFPHYVTLTIPRASTTIYTTVFLGYVTVDTPASPQETAATTQVTTNESNDSNGSVETALIVLGVLLGILILLVIWCVCSRSKTKNGKYRGSPYACCVGQRGSRGHRGHQGANGRDGQPGRDGNPGPEGPRGVQGQQGQQGMQGPQGVSGEYFLSLPHCLRSMNVCLKEPITPETKSSTLEACFLS